MIVSRTRARNKLRSLQTAWRNCDALRLAISALALVSAAANLPAQDTSASHMHHQVTGSTIDGAEHPELIPDLTAYRLYLISVSEPLIASEEQTKRQDALLGVIGITRTDRLALISILADFYAKYHALLDDYNKAANEAWARQERTDPGPLKLQRDNLVQSTHDAIRAALSDNGWTSLDAFVQEEKKHMKISAPAVKP